MEKNSASPIQETRQGFVLTITLSDPDRRNALSDAMVAALMDAFDRAAQDTSLRAVVLRANGSAFCAGADLGATIERLDGSTKGNAAIKRVNSEAGALFARFAELPLCTFAIVHGPAMGGGFGLAACADVVLATPEARFSLSETTLGLLPGQISPYVAARCGTRTAARLALTAARINGAGAKQVGIVDELCDTMEALEMQLTTMLTGVGRCAREANAETKALFRSLALPVSDDFRHHAASAFLARLEHAEGREGVTAFIAKRRTNWVEQP
ncbi:enoyl-CoA hydratase/isomerase family protein [Sulfitobacter pacificus]|uniref:Isohexenylglutaconyl-CoA hydratase n=1 Tax=Sulfitobacter pacificus TaxID=1499314 RepID=A0ABQ5VQ60_9RHOB|nr:enoyl-CoA hydratase-related protein [Sulfitobacter pacificus]GLQ29202.1 isohexenylglutaconyl-CoA hydratase [Sulfitobacter pacificus]